MYFSISAFVCDGGSGTNLLTLTIKLDEKSKQLFSDIGEATTQGRSGRESIPEGRET